MLDNVEILKRGGCMIDSSLLDKYRDMSDSEKIQVLIHAIHMDEKPLGILLAMLAILEPDRVESIFSKLEEIKP